MSRDESKIDEIVSAIRRTLGGRTGRIGLHEPSFAGNEWGYLKECLDSTMVSSIGPFVDRFEKLLGEYTGSKHVIACSSGTAALHVALLLCGVVADDEVLVPALTFIATANAVHYCGAIPHFVDIESRSMGVDASKLRRHLAEIGEVRAEGLFNRRTGRRIKVLLPIHCFGHPVDLAPMIEIARDYKLELLEDAAESLGSFYRGRHTGTWGRISAMSFNGNKIVTTGGGGAILTDDPELARCAKHLTTTAKKPHEWRFFHDEIGFNYRLPNLNAALGCAQLEQLPQALSRKRALSQRYHAEFASVEGMRILREPAYGRSNFWLNTLVLGEEFAHLRDPLLNRTNALGIKTRPAWDLIPTLPIYADTPQMDLSEAREMTRRMVSLPSSAFLLPEGEGS